MQALLSGTVDVAADGRSARARWQIREIGRRTSGEGMELYGVYTDECVPAVDGPVTGDPDEANRSNGPDGAGAPEWQFTRRRFDPLYRVCYHARR